LVRRRTKKIIYLCKKTLAAMGAKLSTCSDTSVTTSNFPKAMVILTKDQKEPNFMQKIGLKCTYGGQPAASTSIPDGAIEYSAVVEYDWGVVIPLGLAVLLFLIMIVYFVMKMRHHATPSMPPPAMDY
jgi:hypothetical protein